MKIYKQLFRFNQIKMENTEMEKKNVNTTNKRQKFIVN